MIRPLLSPIRSLEVRRTFAAPREKVFTAWTRADALQQWWGVAAGYTTPLAEVDCRVGGRYRLGMLPPDSDQMIILTGEYRHIQPPEKLVFTWGFEGQNGPESLITLRFLARGSQTELILTHEYQGPKEMAQNFRQGWEGMFERLGQALAKEV
ncbi:MAG TPA: SRPBCC domain-containing protein [Anaerolineales bacterium]|nr:SRPBCC domain-containing protein [Anaerolineales bacterium]